MSFDMTVFLSKDVFPLNIMSEHLPAENMHSRLRSAEEEQLPHRAMYRQQLLIVWVVIVADILPTSIIQVETNSAYHSTEVQNRKEKDLRLASY